MTTTPMPTRPPGEPEDPELRDRYRRDAWEQREARRVEDTRAAADPPPSRTPAGPIRVVAALVAVVLVLLTGFVLIGPMLRQSATTNESLPGSISSVTVKNGVGDVRVRVAQEGETPRATVTSTWGLRRPGTSVQTSGEQATLQGSCPSAATVCSTEWLLVVPEGTDLDIDQGVGSVTLEEMDGDTDVNVGVGDATVVGTSSEQVRVEVGVGDARVEAVDPPRDVRARVGVGDLSVALPDTVDYRVDTIGGASEVRNSLGDKRTAERRVVLEIGVGNLTVGPA